MEQHAIGVVGKLRSAVFFFTCSVRRDIVRPAKQAAARVCPICGVWRKRHVPHRGGHVRRSRIRSRQRFGAVFRHGQFDFHAARRAKVPASEACPAEAAKYPKSHPVPGHAHAVRPNACPYPPYGSPPSCRLSIVLFYHTQHVLSTGVKLFRGVNSQK